MLTPLTSETEFRICEYGVGTEWSRRKGRCVRRLTVVSPVIRTIDILIYIRLNALAVNGVGRPADLCHIEEVDLLRTVKQTPIDF